MRYQESHFESSYMEMSLSLHDNEIIFAAVHSYIRTSGRFSL